MYLKTLAGARVPDGLHNYRVWTSDPLAGQLFARFSASLNGDYLESYDRYFLGLQQILAARDIRLVFVLTGLNKELIRHYAPDGGDAMIGMFEQNRSKLRQFMETHRLLYLDLTDAIPPACYADMVHVNSCGDDAMAAGMQEWLLQHQDGRGARTAASN